MKRSAAALLLVLAAACGSDDSPTLDAGATSTTTTTSPASATTTTSTVAVPPAEDAERVSLVLEGAGGGRAEATLSYDGDQLCLDGTTTGVGAVESGHLHAAPAGEEGPAVVDFLIETEADGEFAGCARVGAEGGVVLVEPGSYYVDLHGANDAVRAQIG